MVQFYPWLTFVLGYGNLMYDNEFKTNGNKPTIKLNRNINVSLTSGMSLKTRFEDFLKFTVKI